MHRMVRGDRFHAMKGYKPVSSFDEDVARSDRDFLRGDEGEAVAFLEQLASAGPALELGIGTGRIALPLAGMLFFSALGSPPGG